MATNCDEDPVVQGRRKRLTDMATNCEEDPVVQGRQKRMKRSETWLDLLPLDESASIASMLPSWESKEDDRVSTDQIVYIPPLLALAAVSNAQRRAVSAAMSRVLRIERVNDCKHAEDVIRLWRDVLGDDIRQVHLPLNIGAGQQVRNLLSLPSITKVSIPNLPSMLRALISQRSVKVLELQVTSYCTVRGENGLEVLPEVLRSCPVEELTLVCHGCGRRDVSDFHRCATMVALQAVRSGEGSSSVRSLTFACESPKILTIGASYFPNLQEFIWENADRTCRGDPIDFPSSPALRRRFREFTSIGCKHLGRANVLAEDFGERMTSITSHEPHSMAYIRALEACPNLRSIDLMLVEGAETVFPTNFCSLRSISLSWKAEARSPEEGYYCLESDLLVGIVRRNRHLKELRLKQVKIPSEALELILKCLGERLSILHIPIFLQGESPTNLFSRVIRLIIEYNRNLSELQFDTSELRAQWDDEGGCIPIRHEHADARDPGDCMYCEVRPQVDAAWNILKRRMPRLNEKAFLQLKFWLPPMQSE